MYDIPPNDHSRLDNMTASDAHRIMQEHMNCPLNTCARKIQARRLLIEIGRLVPRRFSF